MSDSEQFLRVGALDDDLSRFEYLTTHAHQTHKVHSVLRVVPVFCFKGCPCLVTFQLPRLVVVPLSLLGRVALFPVKDVSPGLKFKSSLAP